MRVECESCHAIAEASFGLAGDAVRATCSACGHVTTAPSAGEPASAAEPAIDAALCPKCATPLRADAIACASCGLTVARMAAYTDGRDAAVPEPVRDAWTRVTDAWTDPARHDELLKVVAIHNAYAWAASRYRTRRSDDIARRELERLRRAAEATLFASAASRHDTKPSPYGSARSVLVILIVAIVVGAVYATVIRDRSRATPPVAAPAQPLVPGHPVSSSTIK